MSFIHCHVHTDTGSNIRLIDCIIKVPHLIKRVAELNMPGVAITDHESVSAHVRAIQEVKKQKEKGKLPKDFKLILGNEIYLVDDLNYTPGETKFWHFILLAKDEIGHKQLRILSSMAWDNSFYTGKMERTPTLKADLERIVGENPGHLIAANACLGGELNTAIVRGNMEHATNFALWCQGVFGKGNFFLEMQPSHSEDQVTANNGIKMIYDKLGIPYIITCDCHYLKKEDRVFHEAYLNSKEEEREVADFYETTYMMDSEEIHECMDRYLGREAVEVGIGNTLVVGSMVEEYDLYHDTIVPDAIISEFEEEHLFQDYYALFPYIEKFAMSDNEYDRYLLHLIENGFMEKGYYVGISKEDFKQRIERIEIELSEMWKVTEKIKTSISSYYLSTLELIEIMWNEGDSLVGVARGSVTGMYTMYLIGLIQMNPIDWNLPHWRHISWQRPELADVDIDSQRNRRSQIINAVKKIKGDRKVLNCCTFKTEGSKSALLTAARGMGIDNDTSQFLAGMIPVTRGFNWSLSDMVNGNVEEDRRPVTEFINEIGKIPGLLKTAMSIEGLVSGRSIHASAVYIFNDDFTEHAARMKAPNGTYISQFNMDDLNYVSGLKFDLLTVSGLDKIRLCMDFLLQESYMEWQGTLRGTYDKYLHPDVLDYDTVEMWDMVSENQVTDLFQFDTQMGLQAAKRIKPHNLVELATANSIMRLMVSEEGAEQPIDTYIRYKNDISQWYSCMRDDYRLTEKEIAILEKYLLPVYGVGDTQEIVMEISMDEEISGFDIVQSNKLRKSIAKKDKELQVKMREMLFEHGKEIGTSENLLNYIWKEVIGKQLGYSFSRNHTFPYSVIGLQELNLAFHYPIIYWNCACLIVNAGADEEVEDNKSTDYGKIATAISNMQKRGIHVSFPLINEAEFGFIPDEENNRIVYSFKAINGIGDDDVHQIIQNRPFTTMEDFYSRMIETKIAKPAKMVQLIKSGAFTELDTNDRMKTMREYLSRYIVQPATKLTFAQFDKLMHYREKYGIVPKDVTVAIRHKYFKDYVLSDSFLFKLYIDPKKSKIPQSGYHDKWFLLDETAMAFFQDFYSEDSIEQVKDEFYIISEKKFLKEYKQNVEPLRIWFEQESSLKAYNQCLFNECWEKYAEGSLSKWEMDSLSIYYGEHELVGLQSELYGVVDFFEQPEEPEVYDYYTRTVKEKVDGIEYTVKKKFPKYKISRLAGTILDKNKDKHMVTLLTTTGVVTLKFNKGQFLHYNKQISRVLDSGTKQRVEASWFTRGNKILVSGYRNGDQFRIYKYADSVYTHTCHLITDIKEDGTISTTTERVRLEDERWH